MENKQNIIYILKNKNKEMNKKFSLIDKLKLAKFLLLYTKIHKIKEQLEAIDVMKINADLRIYDYIISAILKSTDKDYIIKEISDIYLEIEDIIGKIDNKYFSMLNKKQAKKKLKKYYNEEEIERIVNFEPTSEEIEKEIEHSHKTSNKIIQISKYR